VRDTLIRFQTLRYKNFLSSGNTFTEINFDATPTTLVVGHNGSGKSTMLDALSFGLFGKPHRKISKSQLVNSINGKGTHVEVEFKVGSTKYKIVRCIKPNKFEVWVNDNMMNQSSHAKDYQSILEKNILKLNHKSFHQIVVLGSSSFVPFMQLTGGQRRDVIEDLLDINIFSKMNGILKEKNAILKDNIRENNHSIDMIRTKVDAQKKYLRDLSALNSAHRKEKEDKVDEVRSEIDELQLFNNTNTDTDSTDVTDKLKRLNSNRTKLTEFQSTFRAQIKTVVKEAKFFAENEHCPTCDQGIAAELRGSKKDIATKRAKELNDAMTKTKDEMERYDISLNDLNDRLEELRLLNNTINNNNSTISRLQRNISQMQSDIDGLSTSNVELNSANDELSVLSTELEVAQDVKYTLNEQLSYNQVSGELLKDTGIKTKIIKQYIPVINQLTNNYLQILDFFVHFDLDENFSETIRSRHRDAFSYDSFSEGEKQRIDLSLLFTWRQVAKMKNSVATNLLILDETFDSSLDEDGVDNLMKIIYTLGEDTNVFVISHKSELEDAHFARKIEFAKERNFSKMKIIQ